MFLKNQDCIGLLFDVLLGLPESDKTKKWEEEEKKAVKFSYKILADVFAVDSDSKLREHEIVKDMFCRILERIAIISKEPKRRYVEDISDDEEEEEQQQSPQKMDKPETEEDYKKKVVKKKGVGYGGNSNQKWSVNEYMESKKSINDQLMAILEILCSFLNAKDWVPPPAIIEEICCSALLPLLEACFRSASLLDMAKEAQINQTYLKVSRVLASNKHLLPCLLELDRHYQPPQKESIFKLLGNLKELAQIFLNCLTAADKEANAGINEILARDILDTYKIVEKAV
mmetsp:Transcript_28550/g.25455  ORF Transcript_28550/g.25455 Transcript_28550/m.25455 type:complete len:286 (+) Transcript_28550:433-1290(+)